MKSVFAIVLVLLASTAGIADAGSLWHPLRLSLPGLDRPPTLSYTGRVVDWSTGRPVAGARVWPGDDPEAFATTDARGVYRLAWTPAVPDQIWVQMEGYLRFRKTFHPPTPWIVSPKAPTLAVWPARRLAGIVMRPDGRPMPGAEVRVFGRNPDAVTEITKTFSSDQGRFELAVIHDGDYEVMAASPGLAPAFESLTLGEGQAGVSGIRLVLRRGRTAAGRVVDENDRPVAGARVVLWRNGEDRLLLSDPAMEDVLFQATTDGDGRFEIPDLPAGWFDLEASQPGFLPERFQALEVREDDVDLDTVRLRPGGEPDAESSAVPDAVPDSQDPFERERGPALSGRVLQADGAPAPYALVTTTLDTYRPVHRSAWANADGQYRIEGLSTGERTVEARHDTLGWGRQEVEIAPGENHADITLEVYEPRLARGRVVDPDGVPAAGAMVEQGVETVYTDARGDFAIPVDEDGYELVARKAGYAPAYLSHWATGGAREGLELRLGREASVSGRILGFDPTNPEELGRVRASAIFLQFSEIQIPGRISSDGTYHIQGLSPGEWLISADFRERSVGTTVTISPDEPEVELDFSFPHRTAVRGRVVDADGQPVDGADVRLVGPEEDRQAVTEEDGTFSLEVEDGTYEILAAHPEHALTHGGVVTVSGEPIEGLEIRFERGAELTGRLLGLSTDDLGEIQVRIELNSVRSDASLEADEESGQPPVYRFSELGPGDWTLRARVNAEEIVRRVTVKPGDRTIAMDLQFAFGNLTLSGRVTGYRTIPSGGVAWLRKADSDPGPWIVGIGEGTFEFSRLRPGRYVLDLFDDRNKPVLQREIDLAASQEIEIDLGDLRAGAEESQ